MTDAHNPKLLSDADSAADLAGLPRPSAQIAKIMALVDHYGSAIMLHDFAEMKRARAAVEAALRDAPQAEPVAIYHGRCTIDCGEHGHHDIELLKMIPKGARLYTSPSAPTAVEPDESLKWCSYCGEGVTTFCRGKQSPDWDYKCPVLNLPARASKGTP